MIYLDFFGIYLDFLIILCLILKMKEVFMKYDELKEVIVIRSFKDVWVRYLMAGG